MDKKLGIILTILLVLVLDQALKFYIKTNIPYGSGFNILGLEWARIHFIENKGMAFGISYGGIWGKYLLSCFRIVMVAVLIYILKRLYQAGESFGLLIFFSLIIAGAIGNIIDSAFYGMLFSGSFHGNVATFLPADGGYAPFLQGKVVDMLYFPLIDTEWPDWVPYIGGDRFLFFRPVFNIADSAISVGVAGILLFYRSFFKAESKKKQLSQEEE